ncbi:amidohydrolase, partial [Acidobacteria bacterium AH-259-D05]|nr:amidohydrolase [Acidobacteria bacterium AH-259-D05]
KFQVREGRETSPSMVVENEGAPMKTANQQPKHQRVILSTGLRSFLTLVLLGCLTSCGGDLGELHPDTILFNGKIVTVDEDFSITEAVAIEDGRFIAVGANAEIRGLAGARTEMVDLEGRTVLPGFNDPHEHFAHSLGFVADDLTKKFRTSKSIKEILAVVQEKIDQTPAGEMVWFFLGPGSPDALEEGRFPTRHDLDPISPQHPVLLEFGGSGANSSANTLALRKAGISRRTPQPSTKRLIGEIIKDASGELTGVFRGRGASALPHSVLVRHSKETLAENIKRASELVIPYGITTIGDPNTNMSSVRDNQTWVQAYQQLSARGELTVRINCVMRLPLLYRPQEEILGWMENLLYDPGFGNETLHFGQIKISVYDSSANYKVPREDVIRVIKAVHRAGWQLYIHVGGGESYDLAIEGLEEAYSELPRQEVRHVITHARFPTDHTLEVLKRYNVIVEPQTGNIYTMSDDYEERNADPERPAYGPTPLRTYLDHGITVMTGSDQNPIGPMFTIFEAVNRLRRSGKVINPEERITVEEAIRAVTIVPAYSTFQKHLKGSIEAGKLADLVVLGRDPLTVPSLELKDIPVMRTMIGGKFVYTNPDPDPNQKIEYWYPTRGYRAVLDIPGS